MDEDDAETLLLLTPAVASRAELWKRVYPAAIPMCDITAPIDRKTAREQSAGTRQVA